MHYHVDYPNCIIANQLVDHLFRIEEDLVRIFIVETMALLVCKTGVVHKMQKPVIYVHD